jgi:electron transport complex protein RnfB
VAAVTIEAIDACLPQTQCTRCGYPRCRDYAAAIADGSADIDRCPPGDKVTLRALAGLLGRSPRPLDPAVGAHTPRTRALIDEDTCIGCRKCVDVCPVDAIVGARKLMHTVIAVDCTGCELCLPPCPVDCIRLEPAQPRGGRWPEYGDREVGRWRALADRRFARLAARRQPAREPRRPSPFPDRDTIRRDIRAAIARSRARRR